MKNIRDLNIEIAIPHIKKPIDLEKIQDMDEIGYRDPEYPYNSTYVNLPPKKKKVAKKRSIKVVKKSTPKVKVVVKPAVKKKSKIKSFISWLFATK